MATKKPVQKDPFADWKEVPASEFEKWETVPVKQLAPATPVPDDATTVDRPDYSSPRQPGADESFYLGATQGVTAGSGDEIAGFLSMLGERGRRALVKAGLMDPNVDKWGEVDDPALQSEGVMGGNVYEQERDAYRGINREAKAANPKSYLAGEVTGGVAASAMVPGGQTKMLGTALRGAAEGGLNAMGRSEADTVGGVLKDTAIGAGTGAVVAPLARYGVEKAGQGLSKLGTATREGAQKALGVLRDTSRTQAAKAAGVVGEGAADVGDDLLETGSVRAMDSAKDIAARIGANQQNLGRKLAENLDEFGEKFDMASFAKRAEEEILAEMRVNGIVDPARRGEAAQVISMLRQYGKMAEKGPVPFSTVQTLRESLEKQGTDSAKSLSRLFGEEMSDQFTRAEASAAKAAGLTGDALEDATLDAGTKGTDVWLNSRTGASLARAGESAKDLAQKQTVGVKDAAIGGGLSAAGATAGTLLGGPGGGAAGAVTGAALGVGKKVVQDRLPATAAVMSKKAADKIFEYAPRIEAFESALGRAGQSVADKAPLVGQGTQKTTYNVLKDMYEADPQSLGPVGPLLFEGKTPEESVTTLHVLQQRDGGKFIKDLQQGRKAKPDGGSDIEL